MPDVHWGYGFAVGGVAAMRRDGGVVSPGGIGFDINCGVRLLRSDLAERDVRPHLGRLADALFRAVPCGSRGLGHQVCTDHVAVMDRAILRFGIELPDRQLACAPLDSPEAAGYLGAMAAAANFAWANRQRIAAAIRRAFAEILGQPAERL